MNRGRRHLCRLAAAAAFALLAGCASLSGLKETPRVTLVSIEPVEIRLLEQRYLATIRVQNPNAVELPIDGLDYVIRINDAEFASGVSNQRVTVPAYGEKTLDVGVTSTFLKLFDQIRRLDRSGGTLRYGITGKLGIQGIPNAVPFDHAGEIDLRVDRPAKRRAA